MTSRERVLKALRHEDRAVFKRFTAAAKQMRKRFDRLFGEEYQDIMELLLIFIEK